LLCQLVVYLQFFDNMLSYIKLALILVGVVFSVEGKKKDASSLTDADIHKLDEMWADEDDIEELDLPEHKRKAQPIDLSKIDTSNPELVLKQTKKHKTLMMFVTVSGNPTQDETEEITALWESMLYNGNIRIERYIISANRALLKLIDGSFAYEIKDFLIQQDRCELVSIEGQDYPGKGNPASAKADSKPKMKKSSKGKKKKKTEL